MTPARFESIVGSSYMLVDCGREAVLAFVPPGEDRLHVMAQTSTAGQRPRFDEALTVVDQADQCTCALDIANAVRDAVAAARGRVVSLTSRGVSARVDTIGR